MIRAYCLAFLIAPIAGVAADKLGSTLKLMGIFFVVGALICLSFIITTRTPSFMILAIVLVICIGAITFGFRGIMYAQVNEVGIPKQFTGTAMGILICIGFSPEAYVHLLFGYLMDTYQINAYNIMFIIMAVVMLVGALCTLSAYRLNRKV